MAAETALFSGDNHEGSGPRWVDTEQGLAALVSELRAEQRYALDTEFHRERTYYPHLALVQVGWSGGIALVDPLAVDISPLAGVLRGDGTAVLHASEQDLEVLERACGSAPRRIFDTQLAAGFVGLSSPSLATLVERLLGRRMPKGDRLSDWTRRPLSRSQLEYAAADVAYLLDLHHALVDELRELGRVSWAEEECALLLDRSRRKSDPEEAWWRLKEARKLRRSARGVAQEVAAWRERAAAAADRPARFLLPDLAVVSISQQPPDSPVELRHVRGMDGRSLKRDQERELMAAIERGRALDESGLRLPPARPAERELRASAALGSAWIARRASQLRIDGALLGTRADLNALLRGDPDARLARGWRWSLVGAEIALLASGEAALAVDGPEGDLVLESRSRHPAPEPRRSRSAQG